MFMYSHNFSGSGSAMSVFKGEWEEGMTERERKSLYIILLDLHNMIVCIRSSIDEVSTQSV